MLQDSDRLLCSGNGDPCSYARTRALGVPGIVLFVVISLWIISIFMIATADELWAGTDQSAMATVLRFLGNVFPIVLFLLCHNGGLIHSRAMFRANLELYRITRRGLRLCYSIHTPISFPDSVIVCRGFRFLGLRPI